MAARDHQRPCPAAVGQCDDKMTLRKPNTLQEWDDIPRWVCETCGHKHHASSTHCQECCPRTRFHTKMAETFDPLALEYSIRVTHRLRTPGAPWISFGATRRPEWYEQYFLDIYRDSDIEPAETTTTGNVKAGRAAMHKPTPPPRYQTREMTQSWQRQEWQSDAWKSPEQAQGWKSSSSSTSVAKQ